MKRRHLFGLIPLPMFFSRAEASPVESKTVEWLEDNYIPALTAEEEQILEYGGEIKVSAIHGPDGAKIGHRKEIFYRKDDKAPATPRWCRELTEWERRVCENGGIILKTNVWLAGERLTTCRKYYSLPDPNGIMEWGEFTADSLNRMLGEIGVSGFVKPRTNGKVNP